MYRLRFASSLFLFLLIFLSASFSDAFTSRQVTLPESEVRAAVDRFLSERLSEKGWDVSVIDLAIPKGVKVSRGERNLELIAPAGWKGWGAVNMALVVRINGVVEKNLPLRLKVSARTKMVTASRQLLAGTVLTARDMHLQEQDLAQSDGHPVENINDAVGKKLRSTVRSGAAIRSNQLVSVPVIVSGQLVTIVAENSSIRITVAGMAKSAGGIGDLIRVQNLLSKRDIPARVVDASTVAVGF